MDHLKNEMFRYLKIQLFSNVALESILIYATGGLDSIFFPFLFISILSAAFFLGKGMGLTFATIGTISTSTIAFIYWYHADQGRPMPLVAKEWQAPQDEVFIYYLPHVFFDLVCLPRCPTPHTYSATFYLTIQSQIPNTLY